MKKRCFFLVTVVVLIGALGCPIPSFNPDLFDIDGYITSGKKGATLRRLQAPSNIRVEEGKVKWNEVKGATGYLITINEMQELLGKVTSYDLGALTPSDVRKIALVSLGDGKQTLDSLPSFVLTYQEGNGLLSSGDSEAPLPLYPIPIARQIAWQKLEQYAFIHFGPNTFRNAEWGEGKPAEGVAFSPTNNSTVYTNQWVTNLKEVGMNGVIFTAKHHDGFCLWQTKTTLHSLRNPSYSGGGNDDVVRDLSNNAQANGMILGLYVSPWDRNNWAYLHHEYAKIFKEQVREIVTKYGPIFEVWFDGANDRQGWYGGASFSWHTNTNHAPALPLDSNGNWIDDTTTYDYYPSTHNPTQLFPRDYSTTIDGITYSSRNEFLGKIKEDAKQYIKQHQPNAVIFGDGSGEGIRWVGNEQGFAGRTCWSMGWDVSGDENGSTWNPAECDMKTHWGWFHSTNNPNPKGGSNAHKNYIEYWYRSVGRNATLLLNFSPGRDGLIPEATLAQARLFWNIIKSDFETNLVSGVSRVEASNIRGMQDQFSPTNLVDNQFDSYWATDDTVRENASVTLHFDSPVTFDRVVLQEYIPLGQRVKAFKVEFSQTASEDDFELLEYPNMPWHIEGDSDSPDITTTIGYKRILRCYETTAKRVKVTFLKNRKPVPFVISELGLYNSPNSSVTK